MMNMTDLEFTAFLREKAKEILDVAVDRTLDEVASLIATESDDVAGTENEMNTDN